MGGEGLSIEAEAGGNSADPDSQQGWRPERCG